MAPKARELRPTTDRVREAIFSVLGSMGAIHDAQVIDLFAGTGAIGIEALSRGARSAVFVEADPVAIGAVRANLATTGLDGATVVQRDVLKFLSEETVTYDVAFADPPYAFSAWAGVLERLPADLAVLESRTSIDLGPGWILTTVRRYGGTVVTFARRQ